MKILQFESNALLKQEIIISLFHHKTLLVTKLLAVSINKPFSCATNSLQLLLIVLVYIVYIQTGDTTTRGTYKSF